MSGASIGGDSVLIISRGKQNDMEVGYSGSSAISHLWDSEGYCPTAKTARCC